MSQIKKPKREIKVLSVFSETSQVKKEQVDSGENIINNLAASFNNTSFSNKQEDLTATSPQQENFIQHNIIIQPQRKQQNPIDSTVTFVANSPPPPPPIILKQQSNIPQMKITDTPPPIEREPEKQSSEAPKQPLKKKSKLDEIKSKYLRKNQKEKQEIKNIKPPLLNPTTSESINNPIITTSTIVQSNRSAIYNTPPPIQKQSNVPDFSQKIQTTPTILPKPQQVHTKKIEQLKQNHLEVFSKNNEQTQQMNINPTTNNPDLHKTEAVVQNKEIEKSTRQMIKPPERSRNLPKTPPPPVSRREISVYKQPDQATTSTIHNNIKPQQNFLKQIIPVVQQQEPKKQTTKQIQKNPIQLLSSSSSISNNKNNNSVIPLPKPRNVINPNNNSSPIGKIQNSTNNIITHKIIPKPTEVLLQSESSQQSIKQVPDSQTSQIKNLQKVDNRKQTQQINYLNLVKNPAQLIQQFYSSNEILEQTFIIIKQKLFNNQGNRMVSNLLPHHQHRDQEFNSHNQNYTHWVKLMFETFIFHSVELQEDQYQLTFDFINEFFPPQKNHTLSNVFFVCLVKLSEVYYQRYRDELLKNIFHYLAILSLYKQKYSNKKKKEFLAYLTRALANTNHFVQENNNSDYCKIVIHILYLQPELINEEILQIYNSRATGSFTCSALLYLLLMKTKNKFIKEHVAVLHILLRFFEEKGFIEEGLQLIKTTNENLGTVAYPYLRQVREKLIMKLTVISETKQSQARGNNKSGGIFGFFNQALEKIKIPNMKTQNPNRSTGIAPDKPKDVYYDQEKKRYVVFGEIPEDEDDVPKNQVEKAPVPLPPQRQTKPAENVVGSDETRPSILKKNRIPQNRFL